MQPSMMWPVLPVDPEPPATGDSTNVGLLGLTAFGSAFVAVGATVAGKPSWLIHILEFDYMCYN